MNSQNYYFLSEGSQGKKKHLFKIESIDLLKNKYKPEKKSVCSGAELPNNINFVEKEDLLTLNRYAEKCFSKSSENIKISLDGNDICEKCRGFAEV